MTHDFVVDASVAIKLFVAENDSPLADKLFARIAQTPPARLYVPDLFFVECTNILWKYARRFNYPAENAQQDVAALQALNLRTVSTADLIDSALPLALKFDVTVYDAVYAVLAQKLKLPLITADGKLVRKLQSADVLIFTLSEISKV